MKRKHDTDKSLAALARQFFEDGHVKRALENEGGEPDPERDVLYAVVEEYRARYWRIVS